MKTRKIIISLLFSMLIILCACACSDTTVEETSADTTKSVSNVNKYKTDNQKKYIFDKQTKTLTIYSMDYINSDAPWSRIDNLENVIINTDITRVEDMEFEATPPNYSEEDWNTYNLIKTVKLPETVTYIGYRAFWYCTSLRKINIPDGVKTIGEEAFLGTDLRRITVPGGVKTIEEDTFYHCYKLKRAVIKNGVKNINRGAFINCENLTELKLPSTLEKIEQYAFMGCTKLEEITIPKSVKKIGVEAFGYKDQGIKKKSFTIKGYKGTAAEKYAKKNKFKFIALD